MEGTLDIIAISTALKLGKAFLACGLLHYATKFANWANGVVFKRDYAPLIGKNAQSIATYSGARIIAFGYIIGQCMG